jgi:hypothetical protein
MSLLKTAWGLLKLPVKLVLLPFRIASFIVSLVVYGVVLLLLALIVFVLLL